MIHWNEAPTLSDFPPLLDRFWNLSSAKILAIDEAEKPGAGAPVFTVRGIYTARGWTEWTQGFVYGSALLQYEATGEQRFLELGRERTIQRMAPHITHIGVHDHGFNNVSTYGNLRRLMLAGQIPENRFEREFYELALKCSGAVQAARWTELPEGWGYIHSFNGPHSLFADTIRSLRALALAHELGHALMGEKDVRICLLDRLLRHAKTTSAYAVYFGKGRDAYDIRGRVAHESIFNLKDGSYRCPNSQQGYSPFTTWTRGLAWILLGYAEQLEWLQRRPDEELEGHGGKAAILHDFLETARATADFYLEFTPSDGIPYWDTGAPGLVHLGDYLSRPAEIDNDFEPVDSSAAAIAAQGLLRLGRYLGIEGEGERYWKAGLLTSKTLLGEPYLSTSAQHQGLLLHSVYHRPNGWDFIPEGSRIPRGESCMWGDYHVRELALYVGCAAQGKALPTFFGNL